MKKFGVLLFSFFYTMSSWAQNESSFIADRPGATTGVDIMPAKHFQWETGFGYEHNRIGQSNEKTWTINTSLFRIGISDYAELRFQIDEQATKISGEDAYFGIANLMVGTKVKIFDGHNSIPTISLLGNLLLPGGNDANYLPKHLGGQMHLLFQNDLSDKFGLGYDIGADWNGDGEQPDIFLGACLSYEINDSFGMFIEEYNTFNCETQSWIECGASLMIHPRVQLDFATDISLNYLFKYNNFSVGISWQISK